MSWSYTNLRLVLTLPRNRTWRRNKETETWRKSFYGMHIKRSLEKTSSHDGLSCHRKKVQKQKQSIVFYTSPQIGNTGLHYPFLSNRGARSFAAIGVGRQDAGHRPIVHLWLARGTPHPADADVDSARTILARALCKFAELFFLFPTQIRNRSCAT